MKKKVLIVFGTRPEAIKMSPLYFEFKKHELEFETRLCVTAQHREMLDQVLDWFDIKPDYDLDLMKSKQTLYSLTSVIIEEMKKVLEDFKPDFIFVHGDTTTTLSAALAGFYFGSRICHVEAGLRTFTKRSPFPEEMNRQLVSRITDIHFVPTSQSKENLHVENISSEIICTGNTVIDALLISINKVKRNNSDFTKFFSQISQGKKVILVTGHRRENHGEGFQNVCAALCRISNELRNVLIVYPVHPNPKVSEPIKKALGGVQNIRLIQPLAYPDFIWLMNRASIILTDSGGIQEEAPSLGKPVLLMRDTTERPEAVEAGTVLLVGTDAEEIFKQTKILLEDDEAYKKMSMLHNPYGDGNASKIILEYMLQLDN